MQDAPSRASEERNTLAYDAERYLDEITPLVIGMRNRRQEIGAWLPSFGHLRTLSLPNYINALNRQLRKWRASRTASTINKRRNALTNLVKVLYGRRAAAELVDLMRFPPDPPKPRWLDRNHVRDVLDQLTPGTKTRARCDLLHWTGTRPMQLSKLTRDDFRLDAEIPYIAIPRGRKAKKIVPQPLTDEGIAAVRAFMEADAFGAISCSSANRALARAAERAGRAPFTIYQIRHSFAAGLRRSGTDVADIKNMLGHMDEAMTEIYAPPDLKKHRDAVQRMIDSEQTTPGPPQPQGRPEQRGQKLRLVHSKSDAG